MSDAMNDTMTPQAAARVLADAAGFERSLARRTHGLTFMVWGIASSGMFVSYGFAAVMDAVWWVFAFLWMPWVFLGVITTSALWRSAALARPDVGIKWADRREWTRVLLVGLGVSAVFFLAQPDGPVLPLALLGATYCVFGAFNVFRAHAVERRDTILAGVLMLAVAGALALTGAPIEVSGTVCFVAPAAILCSIGLYEAYTG